MKSLKSIISLILCAALLLCVVGSAAAGSTIYSNEFNLRNRLKLKTSEPTPAATEIPQDTAQAGPEATEELPPTPVETLLPEATVEATENTEAPVEEPQTTEAPDETLLPDATMTPVEVTEEPSVLPTETLPVDATAEPLTPEGQEVPAASIEPEATVIYEPTIALEMVSALKEVYWYGDLIELRAVVSNGDPNVDYASYITWQRSQDGVNWETVDGIGYAFCFVMSESTTGYSWRAAMELPDAEDAAITE